MVRIHLVFFILLSITVCSYAFAQPAVPVIEPLPMHEYQVESSEGGDTQCPSGTNLALLGLKRQLVIRRYASLKEATNFDQYEGGMRALWDTADSNIKVSVPIAGTYTGIEQIIEYISLVVGVVNDGLVFFSDAAVSNFKYFPTNSSYAFDVDQKVSFYCTDKDTCQTPKYPSKSLQHISFKPCSTLIKQVVVTYDEFTSYLATKGVRAASVCGRHEKYCTTPATKQFKDFLECMQFMESIPSVTCGSEFFNGENLVCRWKHSFMMKFRPEVHCSHVGKDSPPCDDESCDGDFAACASKPGEPSYSARLNPRCCNSRKYCVSESRCPWKYDDEMVSKCEVRKEVRSRRKKGRENRRKYRNGYEYY